MNQTKNRMQALGLLDRSFKAATDDELAAAIEALDDDHREGLESFVEAATPDGVRAAVKAGRINGDMEAIAAVLSDLCLADCIEQLGEHADNPSTEQLKEVLPGVAERHGVAVTRVMLASTVAGEATASAIIRDLWKSDELVALPKAEEVTIAPLIDTSKRSPEEQAEIKAKRAAAKAAKKEADRARKAQSAAARNRA
ncbi:MAG TPA: hypothetical protein VK860_03430 [Ilumatobacteraceae bacterium]|nr:hypothetical protein [Ilumatobacteraceae bacterium]